MDGGKHPEHRPECVYIIPLSEIIALAYDISNAWSLKVQTIWKKFVDFFNKAQPLTTRMHQIELLPGLGKKHMWQIIEERKDKPFESFNDIKARVKLMPDPEKIIFKRIIAEMGGEEKYMLFVDV